MTTTGASLNGTLIANTISEVAPIMYAMIDLVWPYITFAVAIAVLYMIQKMLRGFASGFSMHGGGRRRH